MHGSGCAAVRQSELRLSDYAWNFRLHELHAEFNELRGREGDHARAETGMVLDQVDFLFSRGENARVGSGNRD